MQKIHGKVENFAQLKKLLWISKRFSGETHYNLDYKRMVNLPIDPPKIPNFSGSTEYQSKTVLETKIRTLRKQLREAKTHDTWEYLCHAGRTHNGYEWVDVQHDMIGFPKTALKMKSVWATQFVIERLEVNMKKP